MSSNEKILLRPPGRYFVFGGPGAGKGTICSKLARDLRLAHVCVGDLLRTAMENGTLDEEAKSQVQEAIQQGGLAPWSIILKVIHAEEVDIDAPILLDGFPRSLEQMNAYEKSFGYVDGGIYLSCSRETMERRVLNRAKTSDRIDDNLETIRKRFAQHDEGVVPCIEKFREQGRLVEFSCDGDLNEVYAHIKNCLVVDR